MARRKRKGLGIRRALALRIEIQTNSALFFLTPSLVPIFKWLTADFARDYNTNKNNPLKNYIANFKLIIINSSTICMSHIYRM